MNQFAGYNPNMMMNPQSYFANGGTLFKNSAMQPNFIPTYNHNQNLIMAQNMMRQGQNQPTGYQQINGNHPNMNGMNHPR